MNKQEKRKKISIGVEDFKRIIDKKQSHSTSELLRTL